MLSIQTNVNSLTAQQNLGVNSAFSSKTIQRLTSGYRINSAGDDAAGLAVANGLRNSTAELTQGVQNGNNGVAQLQIMDGGLSNISNILDRLQTLATESASTTFIGARSTLNTEYQNLLGEITRQATNVNLNTGGTYEKQLNIYLGGASAANANAQVSVNLASSAVDTQGLGLTGTSVMGGGTGFSDNYARLDNTQATFDIGAGGAVGEKFTVGYVNAAGVAATATATMTSSAAGMSGATYVTTLNNSLSGTGVTAMIGGDGKLQFQGSGAFTVQYAAAGGGMPTSGQVVQNSSGVGIVSDSLVNAGNYNVSAAFTGFAVGASSAVSETMVFSAGGTNTTVSLSSAAGNYYANNAANALAVINQQLSGTGISATYDTGGNMSFQSSSVFTVNESAYDAGGGGGAGKVFATITGAQAVTAADADKTATGAALSAINSITTALATLGTVQGKIGAGENQLAYGLSLAQSQITNFSSAQSQIRDTDVAAEAANLSKAQVLQQASIAAMAQANSAPQQVLALLRG
jgi:flagellin